MAVQAANPMEVDACRWSSSTFRMYFPEAKPAMKKQKRKADHQTLNPIMEEEIVAKRWKPLTDFERPEVVPRKLVDELETETVKVKGFTEINKADDQGVQKQPIAVEEESETIKSKASNKLVEAITIKFKALNGVGRVLDAEPSRKLGQSEEREFNKGKPKFQPFTGRSYRLIDYCS